MATLLNPFIRGLDANGDPVSGAQLAVFEAGTTTPVTTYSDRALSTAQAQPLIANSAGEFAQSFVAAGIYKIRVSDADGVTLYENDNVRIADRPDDPVTFDNEAALLADTTTYATGAYLVTVLEGRTFTAAASGATDHDETNAGGQKLYRKWQKYKDITTFLASNEATRGEGEVWDATSAQYEEAASGATDHHVTNAGGVKFYVVPGVSGYNARAFGATGNGSTDDTTALQAWLDACENRAGFLPFGVYNHSGLTLDPQKSYNISGEAYDNDAIGGSVLENTDTGGGHGITIDNTPFTQNYDSQIRLSNLTIKGNASSGDGVNADQVMAFLENVWITGNGGHGYFAQRCYSSAFRQVSFSNNYKSGFIATRAFNAVHFDHCLFNGNAQLDGWSGCALTGASGDDRNFGVVFTACDFTGNGELLASGTAFGASVQHTAGVMFNGCYLEGNKTWNFYVDSTSSNVCIFSCFIQDAPNFLVDVDGLIFENNHVYDSGGATSTLQIDFGMPDGRFANRMRSTQFTGTVTKTFNGGATEAQDFWFSSAPTGGTWFRGDIVWNANAQSGGAILGWICVNPGAPGTWLPFGVLEQVFVNHGDAAATLTVGASFPTNIWQSPLTTDRTVTLATSGAYNGAKFRIVRTAGATGGSNLVIGSTGKNLAAGDWCDVEYTGSAWIVTAAGSL